MDVERKPKAEVQLSTRKCWGWFLGLSFTAGSIEISVCLQIIAFLIGRRALEKQNGERNKS